MTPHHDPFAPEASMPTTSTEFPTERLSRPTVGASTIEVDVLHALHALVPQAAQEAFVNWVGSKADSEIQDWLNKLRKDENLTGLAKDHAAAQAKAQDEANAKRAEGEKAAAAAQEAAQGSQGDSTAPSGAGGPSGGSASTATATAADSASPQSLQFPAHRYEAAGVEPSVVQSAQEAFDQLSDSGKQDALNGIDDMDDTELREYADSQWGGGAHG